MGNLLNRDEVNCRRFLDALEELPASGNARMSAAEWRAELPVAEEEHAGSCGACRTALEEFAETRNALAGITVQEAGPWFTARVMAARRLSVSRSAQCTSSIARRSGRLSAECCTSVVTTRSLPWVRAAASIAS